MWNVFKKHQHFLFQSLIFYLHTLMILVYAYTTPLQSITYNIYSRCLLNPKHIGRERHASDTRHASRVIRVSNHFSSFHIAWIHSSGVSRERHAARERHRSLLERHYNAWRELYARWIHSMTSTYDDLLGNPHTSTWWYSKCTYVTCF